MNHLNPEAQAHFDFHRQLLLTHGLLVTLTGVREGRVRLIVEATGEGLHPLPEEEVQRRVRAIFRFLPYVPTVTIHPRAATPQLPERTRHTAGVCEE